MGSTDPSDTERFSSARRGHREPTDAAGETWPAARNRLVREAGGIPRGYLVVPINEYAPPEGARWEDWFAGFKAHRKGDPDQHIGTYPRQDLSREAISEACRLACLACRSHAETAADGSLVLTMLGLDDAALEGASPEIDFSTFVRGPDGEAYLPRRTAYEIYVWYRRRAGIDIVPKDCFAKQQKQKFRDGLYRSLGAEPPYLFDVGGLCLHATAQDDIADRDRAVFEVFGQSPSEIGLAARVPTGVELRTVPAPRDLIERMLNVVDMVRAEIHLSQGTLPSTLVEMSSRAHALLGTSYEDASEMDRRLDLMALCGREEDAGT